MQNIQIDGTYTYIDNVKTLKLGDIIVLMKNPNNIINKEAVGAYTKSGKKIGYIPFKSSQIDINAKYTITKINFRLKYPEILISREFELGNIIPIEKRNDINKGNYNDTPELKEFARFLKHSGINIKDIWISFMNENFVDVVIQTPNNSFENTTNIFYTVTKKYYDDHVFYYDELFQFNLTPKCIYQPFQIHRVEVYIERNYKPIDKRLKMKKYKLMLFEIDYEEIKNIPDKNLTSKELENILNIDNIICNGMAYNHDLKSYCYIDMYNDMNIIETVNTTYDIKKMILECIIANKKIININITNKNVIHRFIIPDSIIDMVKTIFQK